MQEQRGLVQQPLGRLDPLDHDAAGHGVQLCLFFGRQLPAREDDHRKVRQRGVVAHRMQHVEAGHIRKAEIKHNAVEALLIEPIETFGAGPCRDDLDVVIFEQGGDR